MTVNILHCIPSPRANIRQVQQYQGRLPYDRFIPYFMKEFDAYYCCRQFFLEHKEYTHLAIGTDDIIVKPEDMIQLGKDLEEKDYPILTGTMNVYQEDFQYLNITKNVVSPRWHDRFYEWIPAKDVGKHTKNGPIILVAFSGFPVMIIRRDVVEKIPFYTDSMFNEITQKDGGSLDVQYCWNAHKLGIGIYADTRVFMVHLRMEGKIRVGKEEPFCLYWPKNKPRQFFDVQW